MVMLRNHGDGISFKEQCRRMETLSIRFPHMTLWDEEKRAFPPGI